MCTGTVGSPSPAYGFEFIWNDDHISAAKATMYQESDHASISVASC
jgi:hypothetical protein